MHHKKRDTLSFTRRLTVAMLAGLALAACQADTPPADPIPPHEEFSIDSRILNETRRIAVYTPPDYAAGDRSYPVLYMPDGGIAEDFPHIANTVDSLIRDGAIAPVLVVGIENTERRRDLTPASTTPADAEVAPVSDGATAFRAFIRDELIPEVEARYRVTSHRAIVGESVAGLFVVDTLFREPSLFETYIAMDPSLWWDDHRIVRHAPAEVAGLAGLERTLWFSSSGVEDIKPYCGELAGVFETSGVAGFRWTYAPYPEERHNTIFRASKERAFREALWRPGRQEDVAPDPENQPEN